MLDARWQVRRELFAAADIFRRRLTKAFNFVLQEKLQLAKQDPATVWRKLTPV